MNKPISFETLEFLYYQENKDSANYSSVICEECKDLVENVYSFHNCSKFKKALMSIFHFIQYNNYDKSDYNKMLKKLCRIMKNVQYNTEDYYKEILKSENLFEKIEEQIDIENKAYQANIDKIDEGIKNKNKYLQDNVKLKSEITIKNNQIVGIEKFLIDEKEKVDSIQNVINDYIPKEKALEEEIVSKEKSIEDTRKNKDILQRELIEIKEYHDNKNKIIEQIKIQISEEYNIHKEDIDGYTNFIQNYILDKKRLTKEIDLINDKYKLFINKISTLKNDGWNEDEIYTLLFNYVNELNSLIQNYKKFGDIECKGNEFDKLFSLTLNSENGSIISMTTNQSANLYGTEENRDLMFDYVIIDEASKCSFEDIVISLPKAKHLVLIGDYMQLDPKFDEYAELNSPDNKYIDSEEKWINLKKSTFSLLFENFLQYNASNNIESFDFCPFIAIMKKQYRMNKGIFNIIAPIYSIHKGFQLVDAKEESANDFKCIQVDSEEVDLTDSTSHRNIGEADQIISFLKFFAENRQKFSHVKTIGLITPYKAQEKYLYRNLPKIDGLEIGTFDRFQGREYDMVIMSLVRTNGLGFTKDIRRMNVGFSRAKKHLLVFGNFKKLNDEAKRLKISEGDTITPQEHAENSFVKNTLIPKLYKDRQEYISIKEMIDDVSKFLRENNYD